MEKKFEQIINEGKRTGKTTTEINAVCSDGLFWPPCDHQ